MTPNEEPTTEALARFVRRVGGLRVRFEDGRQYVRVPSEWIDDLAAVLHSSGVLHAESKEPLAEARATATPGLDVERLARAMWNVRIAHPRGFVTHDERAEAVAAEYAALSASGETET